MQIIEENKVVKTVQIDKEFYEELEVEATKQNISVSFLLSKILLAYFFPPRNLESDYH